MQIPRLLSRTASTLTGASQILIIQGTTAYSCTLQQLFAYGNAPVIQTITIDSIAPQVTGSGFTVSGTLSGYANAPFLSYEDNGGSFALITGTVTATSFTYNHPALSSVGNYTITIRDQNDVFATSNTFAVSAPSVTAASFSTQPASTGQTGTPITYAVTLTPGTGNAYAALYKAGVQEGSRISFTGSGAGPSLTPASTGNYSVQIFASSGATTALATSTSIAVVAAPIVTPSINGNTASLKLDASAPNALTSDTGYATPQTTNGGAVNGWVDNSSNAYNFSNANSGMSLVTGASSTGLSGVSVPTTCNTLDGPTTLANAVYTAASTGNGVTIALAYKYDIINSGASFLISFEKSGVLPSLAVKSAYSNINSDWQSSDYGNHNSFCASPNANTLVKHVITVSPSGIITQYINGVNSGPQSGIPYVNGETFTSFQILNSPYQQGCNFTLYEIDMWEVAGVSSDVTAIDNYYTSKWGT